METHARGPRTAVAATLLVLVAACAHGPATAPGGTLAQINVVPRFLDAWEAVRSAPRPEQLERTRQALLSTHPELFGPEVFGTSTALDGNLERLLVEMPRLDPKLRALSERMPGEIDRSARRFVDEFPELRWSGPVALSLSFSQFEAVWRTVSGKRTLVLGLDSVAFYRGPYAPVDPLIHHALASALLPPWTGPAPAPLWWTVWEEGFPLLGRPNAQPGGQQRRPAARGRGAGPGVPRRAGPASPGALDSTRDADRRAVTGPGRWLTLQWPRRSWRAAHSTTRRGSADHSSGPRSTARSQRWNAPGADSRWWLNC
jgi:hypothetical protein